MNIQNDKVVVVTGGAGFIGSNLADTLLRQGERVVVVDTLARPGTEKNLRWLVGRHPKNLEVELTDIRDAQRMRRIVQRAHTVYHLAGQVAVTSSLEDPTHDFSVNIEGTLNLLEAARQAEEPPVMLFTSTNKVYGDLGSVPLRLNGSRYLFEDGRPGISEGQPLDFHSPYGCSKGAADQYVRDYARIFDLPTCVFRMSCIYGPRQFGNEDQGWVAHFTISAMANKPITLYGDGKQVRDILFVDDLIDAMMRATDAARDEPGQIYNIGGGPENAVSLVELLDMLEDMLGRRIIRRFEEWRPGDQRIYVTDLDKIERRLDWSPQVTKTEGVERLTKWVRANASMILPTRGLKVAPMEQPLTA